MLDADFDNNEVPSYGPGQLFLFYITMEDLLDKLKLLNYDNEFLKQLKLKPLSRHYFAISTNNPGEQFYLFASLAAWLVRKSGKTFDSPQEYDDPNATISTILDFTREFGGTIDFPPNRLKQGCGEHAVYVLNCLTDHALKTNVPSRWAKAEPKEEAVDTTDDVEDESELILEKVEEEMAGLSENDDDEDDETILNLEDLKNIQLHRTLLTQQRPEEMLQSTVRSEEWQVELERVLPQLRVTIQTDARDWRTHLEQMQKYQQNLDENLVTTKDMLDRVEVDIKSSLEKIDSREKNLNGQLDKLLVEYRSKQDELAKLMEKYKTVSGGVSERTSILSKLSEELESVKKQMEERSSNMTDGTPLINAKKAVARIKVELKELDVRLGVLDSEILQTRMRHRALDHLEAAAMTY